MESGNESDDHRTSKQVKKQRQHARDNNYSVNNITNKTHSTQGFGAARVLPIRPKLHENCSMETKTRIFVTGPEPSKGIK